MAKRDRRNTNPDVQRMIDKNRSRTLRYAVVSTIVLAAGIVMIRYLASTTTHLSRVIELKEQSLATLEENANSAESLERNLTSIDAVPINGSPPSILILDALPSIYDAPALNTSILRIAERSGVVVSALRSEDQIASAVESDIEPVPLVMPVTVSGSASYDNFINFLSEVQNSIRPFTVTNIALSSADDGVSFVVEMHTYYQPKREIKNRIEKVE